tara:strand:- start:48 stop:896 length:849 start_codon:yes stop_codon:yes gene_type:complete
MKTLDDLFVLYVEDLHRRQAKTIPTIEAIYRNNIAAVLGKQPVNAINRGDVTLLHFAITERAPYVANKCLGILRATFGLGIQLSWLETNPATHIKKNREHRRKRYLTNAELLALHAALSELATKPHLQKSVAFIRLLLLTGARKGEIAQAQWQHLHDNMLILTEHKTDKFGDDRIIHLTPQALQIIHSLPKDSDYIVGIKNPRRTWETVKRMAGITDMRLHDIRHSYASWSLQKLSLAEVGGLLGHRDQGTTQRYAHIHQDAGAVSASKVGEHIQNILQRNS